MDKKYTTQEIMSALMKSASTLIEDPNLRIKLYTTFADNLETIKEESNIEEYSETDIEEDEIEEENEIELIDNLEIDDLEDDEIEIYETKDDLIRGYNKVLNDQIMELEQWERDSKNKKHIQAIIGMSINEYVQENKDAYALTAFLAQDLAYPRSLQMIQEFEPFDILRSNSDDNDDDDDYEGNSD